MLNVTCSESDNYFYLLEFLINVCPTEIISLQAELEIVDYNQHPLIRVPQLGSI